MGKIRNVLGNTAADRMMELAACKVQRLALRRMQHLYPPPLSYGHYMQLVYTREHIEAIRSAPVPLLIMDMGFSVHAEVPDAVVVRMPSTVRVPALYTCSGGTTPYWRRGVHIDNLPDSHARRLAQAWIQHLREERDMAVRVRSKLCDAKRVCSTIPQLLELWPASEVMLHEVDMYKGYLDAAPPRKVRASLPWQCVDRDEKGRAHRKPDWSLETLAPLDVWLASIRMLPTREPEVKYTIDW